MKATLHFNLDKPEESEEYELIMSAKSFQTCLWNFSNGVLRQICKYDDYSSLGLNSSELTEEQRSLIGNAMEELRSKFFDIVNEHDLGKFI